MRNFRSNLPGAPSGPEYAGIGLKINGKEITDHTNGKAVVVAVTGREVIIPRLATSARNGQPGHRVEDWQLDARTLTVELQIYDYQETAQQINPLLLGPLQMEFLDDPGWIYEGYLQTHSRPRNDRNHQFINLVFHCADPYAEHGPRTSQGATATTSSSTPYPVLMDQITAIATGARPNLVINTSVGYSLTVAGPIAAGDTITINWRRGPIVEFNNVPAPERLHIQSNYQEIREELSDGNTLTAPGANLSISYYERRA